MYFTSDNASGAHPQVLAAITRANEGFARSYGAEEIMARVTARVREVFQHPEAAVYLVSTGTVANSLALAVVDAPMAMTGVANIKYKVPVHVGEKLVAKAEVIHKRGNKYFIWVKTRNETQEVFRAKFIIVSWEE